MAKKITTATPATTPAKNSAPPSKKIETKSTKATKATPAPATTPVVESVGALNVEDSTVEDSTAEESTIMDEWLAFEKKNQEWIAAGAALKKELNMLIKKNGREFKSAKKACKNKKKSGNRSPSGFIKPTLVSDELANFLGKVKGTEMARTEVTKEINAYIRSNKLQDPTNGRHIIPDAALAKLLNLNKSDELTYFNLQKYMSPHFPKSAKALAAAAAATAVTTSA